MARILYFTRDYTTHDHRFLSALAGAGQEVYYLRLEQRGHALEDRPLPPEIQPVRWAGGRKPFAWRDLPRLLFDLKRVLRLVRPDLVQAGPLQTAALLAALSGFHPLVSMSWGYDLIVDARRSAFWSWATRFALQRSAAMVGDSQVVSGLAISYGMPAEHIIAFPWGVDLQHFRPADRSCPGRAVRGADTAHSAGSQPESPLQPHDPAAFILLSTRGWEPIYGVEVIARAFVEAARQRPELRLVMLGSGSLAARLRQIFTEGGVLDRVHFPGQVSQANLPRFYQAADLYLSASHSDGTSISLLEALACGLPALVSDIPGNREWITPGEQGWWFPDGDAGALAAGIVKAAAGWERLPEIGRAARRLAEERADWEKNFKQIFKAYQIALH